MIYYMTTLVWLVFPLYLNQRVIWWCFWRVVWGRWGQGIRQNIDIISRRMDTFLFLCVFHCVFFILLILRNLLLLIYIIVHFILFLSFSCFFLWFTNSVLLSLSFFLLLKIFISFLIPTHFIIMTQYIFQSFLILVYHAKISRSLWVLIFVRVISKGQFTIGFFKLSNAKLHPLNPEHLKQLVDRIIHSFTVQILSDWEFVLHVYLFHDEVLEEIQD